ncbi:hypothetical protein H4R21_001865, partial [Coemansia helicoidea]
MPINPICSGGGGEFSWASPEAAYARIAPALAIGDEQLRRALFEGLVVAGAAEPLGKHAVGAVAAYAETLPVAGATAAGGPAAPDAGAGSAAQPAWSASGIVAELARLLLTDKRTSRVINPALIVADQLIDQGALAAASPSSWVSLYRAVRQVAAGLRAPQRLLLCLKLYGSLALASDGLACLAAGSLLAHTAHPSPT